MNNIVHKIAGIALSGAIAFGPGIPSAQAQNFANVFALSQTQNSAQNPGQNLVRIFADGVQQNNNQRNNNSGFTQNISQDTTLRFAQNVGSCLGARATNSAQAAGRILPLVEILRLAGINRNANVLSAPVCQINGQPYYLIKVLYADGATREFTLRATDGTPYIAG